MPARRCTWASVTWTTNEPADSRVEYGLTTAYGSSTTLNAAMVTSHSQALSGLSANTLYHYRVKSRDAAGNLLVATFATLVTSGASAIAVVTNSVVGSTNHLRSRFTNLRLAMLLQVSMAIGAIAGALYGVVADPRVIYNANDGGFYWSGDRGQTWQFAVRAGGAPLRPRRARVGSAPGPRTRSARRLRSPARRRASRRAASRACANAAPRTGGRPGLDPGPLVGEQFVDECVPALGSGRTRSVSPSVATTRTGLPEGIEPSSL